MRYVIWGAGLRGRRLFGHLKEEDVAAFVDKSSDKIGSSFCGKKVISLDEYAKHCNEAILVIAHTFEENAAKELESLGIKNYMRLSDCPGEFQEENTRPLLKNYVKSLLNSWDTYGIRGCTVYGLEVYSWLSEIGNTHSYMIIDNSVPSETVKLIKESGYSILTEDHVCEGKLGRILNCTYEEQAENLFEGIQQSNLYDCSDVIEEYYNPEIEKLKNSHKGQACVIVATGPSLKMEDLNTLAERQIITFGVNMIGYAYASTKWRPTYFVGEDRALMESEYFSKIKPAKESKYAFLADTGKTFWENEQPPNILKFHLCDEWAFGRYPKFSEDFSRKSYVGGTVVYTCIQLAVYMGFQKIYLLGVDFTGAKEHGSKYSHFYAEKELTSVSYTDQVSLAYEKAKKYADEHGINIYNATRGGKLEAFERVGFDSLF